MSKITSEVRRKPTRADLLRVINRLQGLIGEARANLENDRNPAGFTDGRKRLREAHDLCVAARGFDLPYQGRSKRGWP